MSRHQRCVWALLCFALFLSTTWVSAQDAATGAIRGRVFDAAGAAIAGGKLSLTNAATGVEHRSHTGSQGEFAFQLLSPGAYGLRAEAPGMAPLLRADIKVDVGGVVELELRLQVATLKETVNVSGDVALVETQSSSISPVIEERVIAGLPLNGRRFTDLALLTPGITQDPRGLTSSSNGDLAFGGVRGLQSSFLVDGADNNNGFFAQARGRYRAPYQFSNEVIQEFRVSSNSYEAELGRAGGAVINVVTRSGSNHLRGAGFYYLRDSGFNARHPFVDFKPDDRQQQFGFTLGGPIRRNKAFFYAGFDQHIFHVPTVVRFLNGAAVVTPQPADYEPSDEARVRQAAASLSTLGGQFRSALVGNAGFLKLDYAPSARHFVSARLSTSRYNGQNNVFFDPASPITTFAISENGEEEVSTESAVVSLTSALTFRVTSHLRAQFSRDLQQSSVNSSDVRTRIYDVIDAFGRSSILPRRTREHRLHLSETITLEGRRHSWKFGGDLMPTWTSNFFPMLFGGEYIFGNISVNPFTFVPQTYGLHITPLRAWAHAVPRYFVQNFGEANSDPDTREYSVFAQDSIRLSDHFALTLGVRYDLQTFATDGLRSNPLWPDSGKTPRDGNNFAPRVGFAYSFGHHRPLVLRGGYGLFYTRIPSIYTSAVQTDNGFNRQHLFLDNAEFYDRQVFPRYPNPLVSCPVSATRCVPPASAAGKLSTEISSFARDFRTPSVHQASLSLEREVARRLAIGASYLYVHGEHLIRARDANLPAPQTLSYPVYDDSGTNYLGYDYTVDSFSTWQLSPTVTCPFPPCVNDVRRPIPQAEAINVFESAASSVYHGLTLSARRRMTRGLYFRAAYTFARAMDDGQDALVVGRPATVQNSYSTASERGLSTTDQRHRFVFAWIAEPAPFHRDRPMLRLLFNDWKFSGVVTAGSGRPVNARVIGDANRDGNSTNDRLPGARRNSFTGPDYATTDVRVGRKIPIGERVRLELLAESFNLLNRTNRRVDLSDDGFSNTAAQFVEADKTLGTTHYPAHYRKQSGFLRPSNAYAPRQVQFAVRLSF